MFDVEKYKNELSKMNDVTIESEIRNVFDDLKKHLIKNDKKVEDGRVIRISSGAVKWEK